MKSKPISLLFLMLGFLAASPVVCHANMSSPHVSGTGTGLPFVSKHAIVLHETLRIVPTKDFKTCNFEVLYEIVTDTVGLRIPLLFIAHHFAEGSMTIWVDGNEVTVMRLPEKYYYKKTSPLSHFGPSGSMEDLEVFEIEWEKGAPVHYNQDELHYFETDLTAGKHEVRVIYTAEVWRDRHEWLADETFKYALDPASHWYGFGQLDVTLDARLAPYPLTTNLGEPDSGDVAHVAVWHFAKLPEIKTLTISSVPTPLGSGQFFMDFGMEGFLWTSGGFLALIHLLFMWRWRIRFPVRKFSWVWLVGTLLVPFVAMVVFCMSYEWINAAIGPAAARHGGYFFLIFIFYPFAVIGYGLIMLLADYLLRRKYRA